MNFKTKERTRLQGIKVGDVVTFTFIQANGDYVITHIQSDR
ncbi:MAG TPA: copper-binding protein [Nitrosomonas mobilis]|nr:copper-binding protein [Nitrosomonas mobilis]